MKSGHVAPSPTARLMDTTDTVTDNYVETCLYQITSLGENLDVCAAVQMERWESQPDHAVRTAHGEILLAC